LPDRARPKAGIADPTLSLIERGYANPTWATVRNIASALGVSMGELAKLADKFASAEK
jgi:transcriptional regulator with XRE-family HTH domain